MSVQPLVSSECELVFFFFMQVEVDWSFSPQLPCFSAFLNCFSFLFCRQITQHRRWNQAPVQMMKSSITPRKTLENEVMAFLKTYCLGSLSTWILKHQETRRITYFVLMQISHRDKMPHIFLCQIWIALASVSHLGFPGSLCSSLESFSTLWFFPFSPGNGTQKGRYLWMHFFSINYA